MTFKKKIIIAPVLLLFFYVVSSCNDPKNEDKKSVSQVVSINISQPPVSVHKKKKQRAITAVKMKKKESGGGQEKIIEVVQKIAEHYDSKGKIDPFAPLIQEKVDISPVNPDHGPVRILTPLEKIELSQIRLVAVIIMGDRRIAMVEEASGKGYEVRLGTYIGKQRGKITQIKDSSIVIKEPVRDFKGRLSERIQEIKLQKNDSEE